MANVVVKEGSVLGIVHKEMDNQNEAVNAAAGSTATRKKMGPAAGHFGGNPTTSGGINRPTKGKP